MSGVKSTTEGPTVERKLKITGKTMQKENNIPVQNRIVEEITSGKMSRFSCLQSAGATKAQILNNKNGIERYTASINAIFSGVKKGEITPIAMRFEPGIVATIGAAINVQIWSAKGKSTTKNIVIARTE